MNLNGVSCPIRIMAISCAILSILSFSAWSAQKNVEIVGMMPGAASDICIDKGYAYLCTGNTLTVLDVHDPSLPTEITRTILLDRATGIFVIDGYAYVTVGKVGLQIIDILNPAKPKELGYCYTGWATSVYVKDKYAYVGCSENGLRVIDISNKYKPSEVGSYSPPDPSDYHSKSISVFAIEIMDRYAYILTNTKLRILDIWNPPKPRELGIFDISINGQDIKVIDGYVYVTYNYGIGEAASGFLMIDATDPNNPKQIGFYGFDEEDFPGPVVSGFDIVGRYAYVADLSKGLFILDISNLANPNRGASKFGSYYTAENAVDVRVIGRYAYLVCGDSLRVLDVSNRSSPREIGFYDTSAGVFGVYVADKYAYIADYNDGLRIIDVSNSPYPKEVGFCNIPGAANEVQVVGRYAYVVAGSTGLWIVDISDPTRPYIVGSYDTSPNELDSQTNALDIQVLNGYAYIANQAGGLRIIDVSNPTEPKEVSYYDTSGHAMGVCVADKRAYIADLWQGLHIVDVSDPSKPKKLGTYRTGGYGVQVANGYAYVICYEIGLRVIDVSDPTEPKEVGFYEKCSKPVDICLVGKYAYITDRGIGLVVIDVSDPKNPKEAGFYDDSSQYGTGGIYVANRYIYLANEVMGFCILSYKEADANVNSKGFTKWGQEKYYSFQNYPNPFNQYTWIPFQIDDDSDVQIIIYDSTGKIIRTLNLGYKYAGLYIDQEKSAYWDGKNEIGEQMPCGVYFYAVESDSYTSIRKMTILP